MGIFSLFFLVFLLVSSLEVEAAIYPLGTSRKHEIEVSYEITYKRNMLYRFGLVYTCSDGTKELFVSDLDKYLLIPGKNIVKFDDDGVCLGSSIETLKGLIYAVDAPLYI